jgi:tetratricopeptide (TPR) repeat protein
MSENKIICTNLACKSENVIFSKKRNGYFCEDCEQEVIVEKPIKQMNIFVSYGRDQYTEFAEKIKADLKTRGHNVWFDKGRLKEGRDWEHYIEEGLKMVSDNPANGRFVYIITPHSARKPDGYCLNEISRILTKNVGIVPVMLVYCELPLSICRIQWLDAQNCVNNYSSASYDKTFQRLIEALEHDKLDYEGVQSNLLKTLKPIDFGSDIYYNLRDFTGRKWLIDIIDIWLADENGSKVFVLQGGPGVGKTAISAYLIDKKKEIAGYHLCNSQNTKMNNPVDLVKSIAYQISTQLKEYQDRLALINIDFETDAITLFNQIIAQPLYRISKPEGKIFILIDALDEAKSLSNINEIADLISSVFRKTPDWLRMIVTTRPEPGVIELLQKFNPYLLDASSKENINDIKSYLNGKLQCHSQGIREKAINSIIAKSEGNFLYAKEICEEIEDSGNKLIDIEHPDKFPFGMGGLYLRSFQRKFGNCDYRKEIDPVLRIIISALEPISIEYLCRLLSITETELYDFLNKAGSFFPINYNKISPFHKSLVEWITNREYSNIYAISRNDSYKIMGDLNQKYFSEIIVNPNEIDVSADYCIRYVFIHLYLAGMKRELEENLLWVFNAKNEIKQMFIIGVENLFDWVLANHSFSNESLLIKIVKKISNEESLIEKTQYTSFIYERAKNYIKKGHSRWALKLYEAVLIINIGIVRVDPKSRAANHELSWSYFTIAKFHQEVGNNKKAKEFLEKAMNVMVALIDLNPNRADLKHDLSIIFGTLSDIHVKMGSSTNALYFIIKAMDIIELLLLDEPNSIGYRHDLSAASVLKGIIYREMGDRIKALEFFEQSLKTMEFVVAMEPDRTDFRRELSVSFNSVGNIYSDMGDAKKALEFFEQSLKIRESLVSTQPDLTDFRQDLSVSFHKVGNIYREMGDHRKALEFFEQSLKIRESLVAMEPDRTDYQHDLAGIFNSVGNIYKAMGEAKKALEFFENVRKAKETLVVKEPDRIDFNYDLLDLYDRLGNEYSIRGDIIKALEIFEKYSTISEYLIELEPENNHFKDLFSMNLDRLGNIYRRGMQGKKKAIESYEKASKILESLVATLPLSVSFRSRFSRCLHSLAGLYESIGDSKKAKEILEQSLKVKEETIVIQKLDEKMFFNIDYVNSLWDMCLTLQPPHNLELLNTAKDYLKYYIDKGIVNKQLTQMWGMVNEATRKIEKN